MTKEYFSLGIAESCNSWKKRLFVMCKLPCIVVAFDYSGLRIKMN